MNDAELDQYLSKINAAKPAPVPAKPSAPDQGAFQAALQGGVDAVPGLKQLSAYLESHAPHAPSFLTNGKNQTYQQNLTQDELDSKSAEAQHPVAHAAGQVGMSGLEMATMPGLGLSGQVVKPAAQAALLSGAQGASDANAEGYDAEDSAKEAALNAIIGGGLGGLTGAASKFVGKGVDRLRRAGVGMGGENVGLYDLNDPNKSAVVDLDDPQYASVGKNGVNPDAVGKVNDLLTTLKLGKNNAQNQTNQTANNTAALVGKVTGNAVKGFLPGAGIGAIIGADADPDDRIGGAVKGALITGLGGSAVEASIPALEAGTTNVIRPTLTTGAKIAGRLLGGQHLTPEGVEGAQAKLAQVGDNNAKLGFNLQDFINNSPELKDLPNDADAIAGIVADRNAKQAKIDDLQNLTGKKLPVNFQSSLLINKNPILPPMAQAGLGMGVNAAAQGSANTLSNDINENPVNDLNPAYSTSNDPTQGTPVGIDAVNQFLNQSQAGHPGQLGSN